MEDLEYYELTMKIMNHVKIFFNGNQDLVNVWINTSNSHLGFMRPIDLIANKNAKVLLDFIENNMKIKND